ncbi:hypothetical protein [Pedobacter insulae]|uniref:Tetratricopeptide repeat-containing protein n=1 Tax=Pedobacter insulae TaxID=414048 RepID=A0A1I2T7R8_9SPHI|nr:hypothetical protein [Pedobacter insulae]SFG61023.1 hypothetical protein SAMN04489864_101246 [Pedobacter insulae]
MELTIEIKKQLTDLLARPAMVSDAHMDLLTDLIKTYPFYQPLHLLLAKASQGTSNYEHALATASLYNGGALTYQMMFRPETLVEADVQDKVNDEQETFEEISEVAPTSFKQEENEEEVFEEIAEVDTSLFVPDELAIESIVASDFFAFEQNFSTEQADPLHKGDSIVVVTQPEEYNQEAEAQSTVSKYDDDKLPYTFLWWLAKTRKEHEQIFQPYVTAKQQQHSAPIGELQHQYVEHIFHLQTPFNVGEEAKRGPVNLQAQPKGTALIDSFIKNDPQIKALKPEQINTENKAKKSAEDNYDLVSETLASIYIEQMLYHKAIDTYEKLSLKFPEKSRYFADLIQSLEKKI